MVMTLWGTHITSIMISYQMRASGSLLFFHFPYLSAQYGKAVLQSPSFLLRKSLSAAPHHLGFLVSYDLQLLDKILVPESVGKPHVCAEQASFACFSNMTATMVQGQINLILFIRKAQFSRSFICLFVTA